MPRQTYSSKVLLDIVIQSENSERAAKKWKDLLEKIKYQVSSLDVEVLLEPDWRVVENADQ